MARQKKASKASPPDYRGLPIEHVQSYANLLLAQIKQHLSHVISFTRQDLLQLPVLEFDRVAMISRYRETCIAVSYLLEQGKLVRAKFPDLCLPAKVSHYQFKESSVVTEYDGTIRRLIRAVPAAKTFTVMHVVNQWRTDPQLTADTKRKAVRLAIPRLVREGLCTRLSEFEYTVGVRT